MDIVHYPFKNPRWRPGICADSNSQDFPGTFVIEKLGTNRQRISDINDIYCKELNKLIIIITYELKRGWNFETSRKYMRCQNEILISILQCILKMRLVYRFELVICCFPNSETLTNSSVSDQQDFVKTRNFSNHNIIMT